GGEGIRERREQAEQRARSESGNDLRSPSADERPSRLVREQWKGPLAGRAAVPRECEQQPVEAAALEKPPALLPRGRELLDHEVAPARVHPRDARGWHLAQAVVGELLD